MCIPSTDTLPTHLAFTVLSGTDASKIIGSEELPWPAIQSDFFACAAFTPDKHEEYLQSAVDARCRFNNSMVHPIVILDSTGQTAAMARVIICAGVAYFSDEMIHKDTAKESDKHRALLSLLIQKAAQIAHEAGASSVWLIAASGREDQYEAAGATQEGAPTFIGGRPTELFEKYKAQVISEMEKQLTKPALAAGFAEAAASSTGNEATGPELG